MFRRFALFALILLGLMLPFEMERAWLVLGPLALTNVEIVLFACLFSAALLWQQQRFTWQRPFPFWWLFLLGCFILILLLSSGLAEFRTVAFKASLRTITGVLLALAAPLIVRSSRDLCWVALSLVGGGLLAALLGLLEFMAGSPLEWLTLFRLAPTMAGPFLRLTGPFDFANQAAMFIEATMPFSLVLVWLAYVSGRRTLALGLALAILIYLEAAFLTFSRASFATILIVALAMVVFLWSDKTALRKQKIYLWASMAGLSLLLIPVNLLFSPAFQLRLSSEGDNEWYQARIEVPSELRVDADEILHIPVTLVNEGDLTWENTGANPVVLSVIWVRPQTNMEWANRLRWPLAEPLAPGEQLSMVVPVPTPPQDGEYRLRWDLLQEDVVWFSTKSETPTSSRVIVGDGSVTQPRPNVRFEQPTPSYPPIPGRLTLWRIAWQLLADRPLLGIGLDNFRLVYGRELDQAIWNETIHSNSWYVETLVSVGIIGSLPFLGWLALMTLDIIRTLRNSAVNMWQTAVAAGILAFFVHGLLDYFLLFNTTALLFWLLIGLWFSLKDMEMDLSF
jgi:hypothetical protein